MEKNVRMNGWMIVWMNEKPVLARNPFRVTRQSREQVAAIVASIFYQIVAE